MADVRARALKRKDVSDARLQQELANVRPTEDSPEEVLRSAEADACLEALKAEFSSSGKVTQPL
ncbi:MAG: hypothetical protein HZA36_01925 [Parcubacteria group bacterium]|nr:hypothetical protein [Parcubacteria group bacterium]